MKARVRGSVGPQPAASALRSDPLKAVWPGEPDKLLKRIEIDQMGATPTLERPIC